MTNLQLSLLAASGVVVVGVFAYNKWQEWRHRKVAQAVFAQDAPDDVLMGRQETEETAEAVPPRYLEAEEPSLESAETPEPLERREPSLQPLETQTALEERVEPSLVMAPMAPVAVPEPVVSVEPGVPPLSLEVPAPSVAVEASMLSVPSEPVLVRDAPAVSDYRKTSAVAAVPRSLANSDCDAILALELTESRSAAEILHAQRAALQKISKPVFWLGLNPEGVWVVLGAETQGRFGHLRLVVQLADRRGPLLDQELYALQQIAQAIAVDWNAVLDEGDLETALLRGRQLDQFCVDVDLQIGINLVGPIPFMGTKIRALAEAAGMTLNLQGAFEKQDDNGNILFTLSNQESNPFAVETLRTLKTHGLTFLLDVPRVADTGFVFDHMLRLAKQFSEALQAKIVDDNRRPLTDAQLVNIREQFVVKPQQDMATRKIPAGGALALRLFS